MPPRSSRGRGGQGARSQAAPTDAGPSTSGSSSVLPAVAEALDALSDAAPSLLRPPGPGGAQPADLSRTALIRLLGGIIKAEIELDELSDDGAATTAALLLLLLLPRCPVTFTTLYSQPVFISAPYEEGAYRGRAKLEALVRSRVLSSRLLALGSAALFYAARALPCSRLLNALMRKDVPTTAPLQHCAPGKTNTNDVSFFHALPCLRRTFCLQPRLCCTGGQCRNV